MQSVAHACNPIYSGGGDQKDHKSISRMIMVQAEFA
jgi:hypothetical protein